MKRKIWLILALCIILTTCGGFLSWVFYFKKIQAIKEMSVGWVDLSRVSDGIHDGCFETPYKAYCVKVSVMKHKIIRIEIHPGDGYFTYYDREVEPIARKVVSMQKLDVDAVSGATVTSKAILKAIENTLSRDKVFM